MHRHRRGRRSAWRRSTRAGWVTAEYAMLPASTTAAPSESALTARGRSMEIERLIGRSLRPLLISIAWASTPSRFLTATLRQIYGTRTAITGAFCGASRRTPFTVEKDLLPRLPLTGQEGDFYTCKRVSRCWTLTILEDFAPRH